MNIFKKKVFSLFVACLLLITCCLPIQVYANDKTVQRKESSINIVTPDSFGDLFGISTVELDSNNRSVASTNNGVNYSYTFNRDAENENIANVNLTFVMDVADTSYWIETSGQVDLYELESEQIMWEGLIRGNVDINNNEYKVLVGFMKLEGVEGIKANVTLQPTNEVANSSPTSFWFGDLVISPVIKEEIRDDNFSDESTLIRSGVTPASTETYVLKATSIKNFSDTSIGGEAQYIKMYFNDSADRVALSIKSYTNHVDDCYEPTLPEYGTVNTSVKSFAMSLTRSGSATQIQNFDSLPANTSGSNVLIKSFFEDAMSLIGIPTATINAMLNNARASYSYSVVGSKATLNLSFGITQNVNFDSGEIATIINLYSASAATGKYVYTNDLTYRVTYYTPTYGTSYFYVDAIQASCSSSTLTIGN